MSLRFIVGRAGTGKTHQCLVEITNLQQNNPEKTLIYLVPEQSTFSTEKSLLQFSNQDGSIQSQVLSFQRLAWRVLQETGGGIYPVLNDVSKTLILRLLLEKDRGSYQTFAQVMDTPGFLEELRQSIAEFKSYNISPEQLAGCMDKSQSLRISNIQDKLEDLIRIYCEYDEYIEKKYLNTEDILQKVTPRLAYTGFLKNAEIWLDGFNGFTPQEYEVIRELLKNASRVNITLCLNTKHLESQLDDTDTFYPPWETYQKLIKISQEIKCQQEKTLILQHSEQNRFSRQKELAFLEESFFHRDLVYEGKVEALKLMAAANRRVEMEGTAREILNLCRDKNYRFQEIAVLFRDITPYESLIPTAFTEYGIPYFLDAKRPMRHHPLVDLLQASLDVLESGWNHEPVFRYLKTDLVPLSRQEVDLLENYCLAHGIRGKRWIDGKTWKYVRRYTLREDEEGISNKEELELKRINKARDKAVAALSQMEERFKGAETVRTLAEGIYEFLERLGAADKLYQWSQNAESEGLLEEARLHSLVWHKILELLDQLVDVLGDQKLSLKEFNQVLKSGLESIEIGLIPPGLDQVLVGILGRSRNSNMKAVFLLGVNDGVLPARVHEEGLFTDEERIALQSMNIELAPTSEKRLFAEQFTVYMALTRSSDFLQVSCPLADEEGRALSPSHLFNSLEKRFPSPDGMSAIEYLQAEPEIHNSKAFIVNPNPSLGYLAVSLRQAFEGKPVNPLWWDVYDWYLHRQDWQKKICLVIAGLFERNRPNKLTNPIVRKLYGSRLLTSISKLERFKACPFSYFLNYGLALKEREEYKLKAPDLGQFFHAALENSYHVIRAEGLCLAQTDDAKLGSLVDGVVDQLIPQLQNELLLSTSRYRYLTRKLKRTVLRAVRVLREHERRGTFQPVGLEISFGNEGQLPGLQLKLADGTVVILQGRIDRVDSALGEDGYYLRVIDFKSGTPTLSLLEIFYGLKLQLIAYLDIVLRYAPRLIEAEAKPGGILYFKIRDPFVTGEGPLEQNEIEMRIMRNLKMNGYLLKDPEVVRLMDQEINGHSELIPAAMKKDGEFYKNSNQLFSLEEFKQLREHVERVLIEIGEEIISGNVAISPYRYKGKSPCQYCIYHPICRFDPGISGQEYRDLPQREHGEIWYEIGALRRSEVNG